MFRIKMETTSRWESNPVQNIPLDLDASHLRFRTEKLLLILECRDSAAGFSRRGALCIVELHCLWSRRGPHGQCTTSCRRRPWGEQGVFGTCQTQDSRLAQEAEVHSVLVLLPFLGPSKSRVSGLGSRGQQKT